MSDDGEYRASVLGLSAEAIDELRHQYLLLGGKLSPSREDVIECFRRASVRVTSGYIQD